MKLRPHHLLCIQKFTGHGCDAAFTAHLTAVCTALREQPEMQIELVQGADDLCRCCPHLAGGICDTEEQTGRLDRAVLHALSRRYAECGKWLLLAGDANAKILQTHAFHEICSGCQWYALCKKTEVLPL